MINSKKYYSTGMMLESDPSIHSLGYYWLLKQIKQGKIEAINTSKSPLNPRYKIRGNEIVRVIASLK